MPSFPSGRRCEPSVRDLAGRSTPGGEIAPALAALSAQVASCRRCPRLVAWREEVAASERAQRSGEDYWARPLPGWGDPAARLLVVGLAPAAHGGNRTGRMFTGDRSGDFLFAALHRAGYANQPESISANDGLVLRGAYVTAPVRCAPPQNRPLPEERAACAPFLSEELELLGEVRVVLALGAFALDAVVRQPALAPLAGSGTSRARFGHGREIPIGPLRDGGPPRTLLCSYHPSQRNVFTGLLNASMFDAVLERARALGA